ncbi:MAG: YceI family protein [Sphingobacteriales bacterium]|nr:MAG: YceI family protein [Sphingobacteriales bacterium]
MDVLHASHGCLIGILPKGQEKMAAAPDNFKVDTNKSTIVWTGKKVTGEHTGNIKIKNGVLQHDGKVITGGAFDIDMTTITDNDLTDAGYNAKLVGHLKSDDFFGVEKYPVATMKITGITFKGGDQYELTGDLTIKGKTDKVKFPATVSANGNTLTAKSKITVDRSKYDVKYGSKSFFEGLGDKTIYDDFDLDVNLVAVK